MSGDLTTIRRRKEVLESEIQRFVDAIAHGGHLDSLVREIATREVEPKGITNRLVSASATSMEGRLREIRRFVEKGISDLSSLLNRFPPLHNASLHLPRSVSSGSRLNGHSNLVGKYARIPL